MRRRTNRWILIIINIQYIVFNKREKKSERECACVGVLLMFLLWVNEAQRRCHFFHNKNTIDKFNIPCNFESFLLFNFFIDEIDAKLSHSLFATNEYI